MTIPRYNHRPEELEQIQQDFVPVRKRHWLLRYGGIGFPVLYYLYYLIAQPSFRMSFIPVIVGFLIATYAIGTWRCPVCNGWLGKDWTKGYCPHCGTLLTELKEPAR